MATIATTDLTTQDVEGSGVFDELMYTVQIRLEQEYTKNRIQGSDYSKLYLGAMTAVLQQSIAFLLGQQAADKQADLLAAQVLNESLKGDLLTAQIAKTESETALIDQNKLNAIIAGANLTKQGLELTAQTALISAQETKLAGADTALVTAQTTTQGAQKLLVDAQELKTDAETAMITRNTANAVLTGNIIPKQGNKLDAEIALLLQKTDTEKAQIMDTINANAVTGVVGKQKDLFTTQKEGFLRNAEQKLAKIVTDAWAVRSSVRPDTMTFPVATSDDAITEVLNKARAGIGVV